mmetsp:Transcript_19040/g.64820  ORF Transcript_19040/g.64820 Transcript_19040/m.64820 type:complete len:419 (-) Transcript_19040:160-1416(-)
MMPRGGRGEPLHLPARRLGLRRRLLRLLRHRCAVPVRLEHLQRRGARAERRAHAVRLLLHLRPRRLHAQLRPAPHPDQRVVQVLRRGVLVHEPDGVQQRGAVAARREGPHHLQHVRPERRAAVLLLVPVQEVHERRGEPGAPAALQHPRVVRLEGGARDGHSRKRELPDEELELVVAEQRGEERAAVHERVVLHAPGAVLVVLRTQLVVAQHLVRLADGLELVVGIGVGLVLVRVELAREEVVRLLYLGRGRARGHAQEVVVRRVSHLPRGGAPRLPSEALLDHLPPALARHGHDVLVVLGEPRGLGAHVLLVPRPRGVVPALARHVALHSLGRVAQPPADLVHAHARARHRQRHRAHDARGQALGGAAHAVLAGAHHWCGDQSGSPGKDALHGALHAARRPRQDVLRPARGEEVANL